MGKKSAKKKERKLVKAKSDTFVEMEKKFRDLERRLDDIFSENWGNSVKMGIAGMVQIAQIKTYDTQGRYC